MISVIIVSFNTKSLTRKCLQSIKVFEDIKNLEIIVVEQLSRWISGDDQKRLPLC